MALQRRCLKSCWWCLFAIAFYIIVAAYFQSPPDFSQKYLYQDSPDVQEVTEFLPDASQHPQVVIFYSPYCVSLLHDNLESVCRTC